MSEIINRVANSSLVSIDMDDYIDSTPRDTFDIKEGMYQGLILREKEFRQFVKDYPWEKYSGKNVLVLSDRDAIVPSWAYMLVVSKLQHIARLIALGREEDLEKALIDEAINKITDKDFTDQKVVIKGCGEIKNRDYAYFELAKRLVGQVSSMMYGEPCSTVPVFKRKS